MVKIEFAAPVTPTVPSFLQYLQNSPIKGAHVSRYRTQIRDYYKLVSNGLGLFSKTYARLQEDSLAIADDCDELMFLKILAKISEYESLYSKKVTLARVPLSFKDLVLLAEVPSKLVEKVFQRLNGRESSFQLSQSKILRGKKTILSVDYDRHDVRLINCRTQGAFLQVIKEEIEGIKESFAAKGLSVDFSVIKN